MMRKSCSRRKAENILQMLDVSDRHPQRLYLGQSLAAGLGVGKTCSQLSEDLVAVLHPGSLSLTRGSLVLLSLVLVFNLVGS